jgi:hypothetical protein
LFREGVWKEETKEKIKKKKGNKIFFLPPTKIFFASIAKRSNNLSAIFWSGFKVREETKNRILTSWTSSREVALQICPLVQKHPNMIHSTASAISTS